MTDETPVERLTDGELIAECGTLFFGRHWQRSFAATLGISWSTVGLMVKPRPSEGVTPKGISPSMRRKLGTWARTEGIEDQKRLVRRKKILKEIAARFE